jgi:predicted Zn-dependent protease with MMP-like domain
MRISIERFEQLAFDEADKVLAQLPPDLRAEAETVILDIAEMPGPALTEPGMELLGLYEGVPLVERHADLTLLEPDRITLYQNALQARARTEIELRHHIRKTLIHELGHFFGFDEHELARRGWA